MVEETTFDAMVEAAALDEPSPDDKSSDEEDVPDREIISANTGLKRISELRAYFQSKDYCNDQIMEALKMLESHSLKDLEQSNTKQRKITEFL